jgi:hypothetical protein
MAQTITVLGIDIATQVFHLVGMDDSGRIVLRKRLARRALLTLMANVPPVRIGMDAVEVPLSGLGSVANMALTCG